MKRSHLRRDLQIDADVHIDNYSFYLNEDDLEELLKKHFHESVWDTYENLPKEDKLQLDSEFEVMKDVEENYHTVDISFSQLEDIVSGLDEEDAKLLFSGRFDNCSPNPNYDDKMVSIPNLEAEYEFEEFLKVYNAKWNL